MIVMVTLLQEIRDVTSSTIAVLHEPPKPFDSSEADDMSSTVNCMFFCTPYQWRRQMGLGSSKPRPF